MPWVIIGRCVFIFHSQYFKQISFLHLPLKLWSLSSFQFVIIDKIKHRISVRSFTIDWLWLVPTSNPNTKIECLEVRTTKFNWTVKMVPLTIITMIIELIYGVNWFGCLKGFFSWFLRVWFYFCKAFLLLPIVWDYCLMEPLTGFWTRFSAVQMQVQCSSLVRIQSLPWQSHSFAWQVYSRFDKH